MELDFNPNAQESEEDKSELQASQGYIERTCPPQTKQNNLKYHGEAIEEVFGFHVYIMRTHMHTYMYMHTVTQRGIETDFILLLLYVTCLNCVVTVRVNSEHLNA